MDFGISTKGKQTLLYRGFEYVRECTNVNGSKSWRCRMYQKMKCKARVVTRGSTIVSETQPDHTHSGNIATSLARRAVGQMKDEMANELATPRSSQAAVAAGLDDNVLMALPERARLYRTLARSRQRIAQVATGGASMMPVPIDRQFTIPEQFQEMVLYDSGPGDDRIIIFGCHQLLDGLARADFWQADGTFKVVPSLFFQLYSIHFNFGLGMNPAALYCLLPNKTGATYTRVLQEIGRIIPLAAPRKILVDFEKATMNAFAAAYPNATITGCYFHLCQSVIRKVNEVGLKQIYENDDVVRGYVRSLAAIAFVPPEDVIEAFELVVESMPSEIDHLNEVTSFFEHTYVRGRRLRGR